MANLEELEISIRWATHGERFDLGGMPTTNWACLSIILNAVRVAVLRLPHAPDAQDDITSFTRSFNAYLKAVLQAGRIITPDPRIGLPFIHPIALTRLAQPSTQRSYSPPSPRSE